MRIKQLSQKIGAEIYGVNLLKDKSSDLQAQINELLGKHEVIFFKDQPRLTPDQYFDVASFLGTPLNHPFISKDKPIVPGISPFQPYENIPQITGIYHDEKARGNLNEWHSDLNWLAAPSQASVLRCLVRPPLGGDTIWASMTAAYESLDADLRSRLETLRAVHDFTPIYAGAFAGKPRELAQMQALYPACAHPIVLTHPVYGSRAIFVNRVSTTHIVGLPESESRELLNRLYELAKIPEYQCRYRWEEGDIALWDNLLTQHYAVSDYYPNTRRMERISLAGQPLEDIYA